MSISTHTRIIQIYILQHINIAHTVKMFVAFDKVFHTGAIQKELVPHTKITLTLGSSLSKKL